MANGSQQELNDLRSWISGNYPFGFIYSSRFSDINNYQNTKEYQEWLKSNDYAKKYQTTGVKAGQKSKGEAYQAFREAGGTHEQWLKQQAGGEAEPGLTGLPGEVVRWETEVHNGYVWRIGYDKDGVAREFDAVGRAPEAEQGMTEAEKRAAELRSQELEWEREKFGMQEGVSPQEQANLDWEREQWQEQQRQWQMQFQQQQQQFQQQVQAERQQQQELINWYREQETMQQEAEKQARLAQLRANPASWLEYASLAGETPAVQPWMVPLSPKDYGLQIGQALPGWTAEGETLSTLPELTTPSAQYLGRIAPSARQQYAGYEQARTGAAPEDVNWLLASKVAPPGGTSGGLRWIR